MPSTSSSSSSSDFGHLDAPTNLSIVANAVARSITITWDWSTNNHWGDPVTPTGFIVERNVDHKGWEVITGSVPPGVRTYTDMIVPDLVLPVFATGVQVSYRVKAFLVA